MTIAPTITDFAAADAWLGTKDDRTAYLNGTRIVRHNVDTIAVKYHDTDVVTYSRNGSIALRAGGWFTMSTRSRIEAFTHVCLQSVTGRWYVVTRTTAHESTGPEPWQGSYVTPDWSQRDGAFAEGIIVHPDGTFTGAEPADKVIAEDRHNAKVRKMVAAFLKHLREMDADFEGDDTPCMPCRMISTGHHVTNTTHLIDHLAQTKGSGAVNRDLVVASCRSTYVHLNPDWMRAFLLGRLYVGSVATKSGRKPVATPISRGFAA